jgi:hypothetical protein
MRVSALTISPPLTLGAYVSIMTRTMPQIVSKVLPTA